MAITSEHFDAATNTLTTGVKVTTTLDPPIPLETTSTDSLGLIPDPSLNNLNDGTVDGVGALPIRAEKRIIPNTVNISAVQQTFDKGSATQGQVSPTGDPITKRIDSSDFHISLAKKNLTDYVKIRIPHRGVDATNRQLAQTQDAEFRFLINPRSVAVNKQTVDTQAFTRGGWQFGVWGEDMTQIRMSGVSAGSYFALGLTDEHKYYSESYRNLLQLQQVFENNGYWFEGEEYNEGPMAADYLRRRIRMHQDLELWVGNFIWYGMFESMTLTQNADNPFLMEFELTFIAWKERYRDSAGYWNNLPNNVQRGHSYSAVEAVTNKTATSVTLAQTQAVSNAALQAQMKMNLSTNPNANAPAVQASAAEEALPFTDPQVRDALGPINDILGDPKKQAIWNT
jgi:hypothetical protein